MPVFDINPIADPTTGIKYVRCVGHITIQGIDSHIWIVAHELGHQALSKQIDLNGKPVCNWLDDLNGAVTNDGDHLTDAWEAQYHFNSDGPDTTHAYSDITEGDVPDDEVTADIPALGAMMNNVVAWQNDWASPGLQWGKLYFNPKPTGTQEGFYWVFTANTAGTASQGAFQVGQSYHIHNLSDLTAQYPSVLTALP